MTARQKTIEMIKSAVVSRARDRRMSRSLSQKQPVKSAAFMSPFDAVKLETYRLLPDHLIPSDYKGKLVIEGFMDKLKKSKNPGSSFNARQSSFERGILLTPGTNQSMYQYLNGEGRKHIPKLVESYLGDTWYTPFAKLLSRTPFGRDYVIDKIMERTLPRLNGTTDVARQFLAAGGMV